MSASLNKTFPSFLLSLIFCFVGIACVLTNGYKSITNRASTSAYVTGLSFAPPPPLDPEINQIACTAPTPFRPKHS